MPSFPISQALTANQAGFNPLTGWQFEFIPMAWRKGALVRVFARGTTAGIRTTIFSGSQTIQQRSPVQGGGTAGNTPTVFTTNPVEFIASPGDRLILTYDEVLGGTPTLDAVINVDPVP
jgi:hypothetical protein